MDRGRLADALFTIVDDTPDLAVLPQRLCTACLTAVPVDGVGLALMAGNHIGGRALLGASDPIGAHIEELQFNLGEGPCVAAFEDGQPVLIPDIADTGARSRWPMFTHELRTTTPVRAVFAFPLRLGAIKIGALDCYRTRPGPLAELTVALVMAEAVTAALLRTHARETDRDIAAGQPADAASRLVDLATSHHAQVHQATGMIAAYLDIGLEEAFVRLRAYAFQAGRSLDAVGANIVSGALPPDLTEAR